MVGLLLLVVSVVAAALLGPANEWLQRAPTDLSQLLLAFERLREAIPLLHAATGGQRTGVAEAAAVGGLQLGETLASEGMNLTRVVIAQVTGFVIATAATVLLLYFLLASEHWFVIRTMQRVPGRRARLHWLAMGRSAQREIAHFLLTMTLLNAGLGTATGIGLWLLGLPNPLLWGVVTAVLNFVPYLGPVMIGLVLLMAGVLTFDSFGYMVAPPLIFFGLNIVEAYLLGPLVMARRLDLNPVFVFASVMFWGWVWGVAGALVAVPLLLAFRNACRHTRGLRMVCDWLERPAPLDRTLQSMLRPEPRRRWWQRPRPAPIGAPAARPNPAPTAAAEMPARRQAAQSRPAEPVTHD